MTNSKDLFNELVNRIRLDDTQEEIQSIVFWLLETRWGLSRKDVLAGKEFDLERSDSEEIILRINAHEPVQYIAGETEFYGRRFLVNPSVLIPRPETELIIDQLKNDRTVSLPEKGLIVDVGTGSGCIAITLAMEYPDRKVHATDINEDALRTAEENAKLLSAKVEFMQHDILRDNFPFKNVACIVSNPPYVRESEKKSIARNVLDYEPATALFVPDSDPFIFYQAIAQKGKHALVEGGIIIVEINEKSGKEVVDIFMNEGYLKVHSVKDLNGKDRIAVARHRCS